MTELKIAIQKNGRLSDNSHKLLEECGIKFSNGAGVLKTKARNFPVEILFLRDDDIPQYVEQQVADIGILGISPVLPVVVWAQHVGVEPHGPRHGLAHFGPR